MAKIPKFPFGRNSNKSSDDWGLGTKGTGRLLNPDGSFRIVRVGGSLRDINPYHHLLQKSWVSFFSFILVFYTSVNIVFAVVYYMLGDDALTGSLPADGKLGYFLRSFFFSVQTFTTVGYGGIVPIGFWANAIAGLEALFGIMCAALMTGLFFARFSKAESSLSFSAYAIISPYQNISALMFRTTNRRDTVLINVEAQVMLTMMQNGQRKYLLLPLEVASIRMFPMNWTIVHALTEESPLFNLSEKEMREADIELLIIISAEDETFGQKIHTRKSYKWHEIQHGYRFLPMYYTNEKGMNVVELNKISLTEKA